MSNIEALKVAIECVIAERRRFAFDANIARLDPMRCSPAQRRALEQWEWYSRAIGRLEDMLAAEKKAE